jgi:hypothetical protein
MVTHYLHRSMREAYGYERTMKKLKNKKPDKDGMANLHKLDTMLAGLKSNPRLGIEVK